MCSDFPDSVKKLDALVTTSIFLWPGRNPEVIQPDPENTGPSCSCGKKNELGSSMTMSANDDSGRDNSDILSSSTDAGVDGNNNTARFMHGELIIKFRKGVSESKSKTYISKSDIAISDKILFRKNTSIMRRIRLAPSVTVEKAITELRKNPDVEYVQPNYKYNLYTIPDDYEFASQWGLHNTGQTINRTSGTAGFDSNAVNAWDITTNCDEVIIAVLDSGINYTHRDLAANMWNGVSCVDDLGNPLGGCATGYDFVENDKDPKDMSGHGTHVAGIIGAKGNDGNRISGLCWNAKIMAVRIFDPSGGGTTENIISGINFAINNGAKIINASWGTTEYDQALYDAIKDARDNGVLFVAAAGNYHRNNDTYSVYPANFDLDNIISVAAIDQDGELAYFSCYGLTSVDIAAPGTNILSDYPAQMVDATEYFSSWSREWGWEYEDYITYNYIFKGSLRNFKSRNHMDSSAYRVFDLTVNNPDYVMLKYKVWNYYIQEDVNFVHTVIDIGGQRPSNILGTFNKINLSYVYDLTPYITNHTSIGFRFVTTTVIPNEGIEIDPFMISRWYHYEDATTCMFNNGTSMATPFVTGVAGMVWSENTGLTYAQVKSKILNGARFNANLTDKIAGSRMLDAAGALSAIP